MTLQKKTVPDAVSAVSSNGDGQLTDSNSAGFPSMPTRSRPSPGVPWQPLKPAKNIDEVVSNLDRVIDWSKREQSTIGYFAVLYKRATLAVRHALDEGKFKNGPQMEQFDVVFAQCYFDALNAYFCPDTYDGLTLPWEVAFVGHELGHSTMLQHMVAGLNAHIQFDLGIVTSRLEPNVLESFEHDFNLINGLVASQIAGMLDIVQELSPRVRLIRWVIPNEVGLIARIFRKFRKGGWHFAIYVAMHPDKAREKHVNQTAWAAALGAWYLDPPTYWRLAPLLIRAIAKRESRDIAANLQALDQISGSPGKLAKAYL
jgi:hypothetical protein